MIQLRSVYSALLVTVAHDNQTILSIYIFFDAASHRVVFQRGRI